MARSARQIGHACAGSTPAFMQLAKNAAPAPKKVTPVVGDEAPQRASSRAPAGSWRPAGLPSYMQIVVPPSSAPTWEFHMIQPVRAVPVEAVAGGDARRRCRCAACRASAPRASRRRGRARWASASRWCRSNTRSTADGRTAATRRERRRRRRPARSKSCARRAGAASAARRRRASSARQQHHVRARSAAPRAARAARRGGRARRRRSGSRRRRSAPWARSGGSGRAPPPGPCRASTPTRPRRGWRRRGTRPRSRARSAGTRRRGRRGCTPIAAQRPRQRGHLAAQLGPGELLRSPRRIASSRNTIAGWPAACAASAWRNTCRA